MDFQSSVAIVLVFGFRFASKVVYLSFSPFTSFGPAWKLSGQHGSSVGSLEAQWAALHPKVDSQPILWGFLQGSHFTAIDQEDEVRSLLLHSLCFLGQTPGTP